ncbi:MAG: hypothetical protein OEW39_06095 [Deltaproteobacteria bacterium]|nr:hypothetical protein [Deltaproteobacteria bacterium]
MSPPNPDPPAPHPAPPELMTLPALQAYVARVVEARGFTRDLNEVFILLVEEVGELATEFKHRRYYPEQFQVGALALELADVLMYLLDLANGFGVDLAALWPGHEAANDARFASRRQGRAATHRVRPELALNELVLHVEAKRRERAFEDTPESLMILLTEEVGEVATELRRRWKGQEDPQRAGHELVDALTYLFRLAFVFQINLEQALLDKERENAKRIWHY